jgi:hypothetical protein
MSPYLCRISVVSGVLGLFFLISDGVFATPKIQMLIDGKNVLTVGRGVCTAPDTDLLKFVLNTEELRKQEQGFRVKRVFQYDKTPQCPEKSLYEGEDKERKRTFSINEAQLSQKILLPLGACEGPGMRGRGILCFYPNSETESKLLAESAVFTYDTRKPKVIGIVDKVAANQQAEFRITFESPRKVSIFEVCHAKTAGSDFSGDNCPNPKQYIESSIKVEGLENDKEYTFKVRLEADDGTKSDWSSPFSMTPIPVKFILEAYNGKGGDIMWNCQSMARESWIFLLFGALLMLLARMRPSTMLAPLVAIFFFSLGPSKEARAEFGQMSFGILGAMYRPDLDSEKLSSGGATYPFYLYYFRKKLSDQEGPLLPLMGLEADWHLYDGFGSLQLGFGLGYTLVRGKELRMTAGAVPEPDNPTDIPVTLHMYQIRPQLTYLFNQYVEYFPLFPYVRASVIGQGYYFKDGFKGAKPVTKNGVTVENSGLKLGVGGALGLMFRMDFLDGDAIRSAANGQLFDHIYLKAELSYTEFNLLGPGLNFAPKDIMGTGLPLMWTFGLVFDLL